MGDNYYLPELETDSFAVEDVHHSPRETGAVNGIVRRPAISTEHTDIYVDPASGDDSNDGSSGNPIATIQEAFDRMPFILQHQYFINLVDGVYDENYGIRMGPVSHVTQHDNVGPKQPVDKDDVFVIEGDTSTPSNVTLKSNLVMSCRGDVKNNIIRGVEIDGQVDCRGGEVFVNNCVINGRPQGASNGRVSSGVDGYNGHAIIENTVFGGDLDYAASPTRALRVEVGSGCSGTVGKYAHTPTNGAEVVVSANQPVAGVWGNIRPTNAGTVKTRRGVRTGPVSDTSVYADDFGDGVLSTSGRVTHGDGYRPPLEATNGSPTMTGNQLRFPAGNSTIQRARYTIGNRSVGTFTFEFVAQAAPTTGSFTFQVSEGPDNWWRAKVGNGGDLEVEKEEAGGGTVNMLSAGAGTWSEDTSPHTLTVKRDDGDGDVFGTGDQYELVFDGTSQGTTTDAFHPNSDKYIITNTFDVEMRLNSVRVA